MAAEAAAAVPESPAAPDCAIFIWLSWRMIPWLNCVRQSMPIHLDRS